ncbi:DUF885 domain-containing protein [Pseudofulvimonas gallinarii]|uniref:Uncharacterized protein (DUF885 family) n=1 Tax=Pseudofulvimonas gallinarii TaxID=634155 RepID=A0A4R3LFD1_9GAMM|nr:DUF885 family protein [Pseudofulvimonas gallinarii]TCS98891.1 uncharacterized protein (DUF885 family) [Pseudofulvimonas gallinarii]THD14370.1 hypothetical protein B1808_03665 [Pseudofulvimonas gallinarii]
MRLLLQLVIPILLLASPLPVVASDASEAAARFKALYERDWAFRQEDSPGAGDAPARRWPDVSPAAQARRLEHWTAVRAELDGIDPAGLDAAERINYVIFRDQIDDRLAGLRYRDWQMPMNSDSSFFAGVAMMPDRTRLDSREKADAYLARLADIPRYFDQQIANMRAGIKEGRTIPRVVMQGRDEAAAGHADVANAEDSVFWRPLTRLPHAWSEADRAAVQDRARGLIVEAVVPAYGRVRDFLRDEYIPAARETIAAHDLPEGEGYYRSQIREYTTLDLSADEIHRIGLDEVARIRAEMDAIIERVGFDGDFAAFLAFLRTEPRFYAKTPDQLLTHAREISKRIDAELPRYFGKLPRRTYGVAPVPAAIAPFYTAGRYAGAPAGSNEPGWYWVNTWNLPARPLYALPALTLHEAVPGHHLQAALAEEQGEQPPFRRHAYISAFGEGWGLYAEWLGKEMGIYRTPYEDFGRLTYEMWRACRLVVDTGMHAKGWTRDRALAFMRDNTALSEHEITTEIDRYISWPAQALAYKLGEIRLREWRARAEATLGERFDVRDFHDTILALGSVPLSVLDDTMTAWIEGRQAKAD